MRGGLLSLTQPLRHSWRTTLLVISVIAFVLLIDMLPSSAGDTGEKLPWTAAGSTGLPDETDADEIRFSADRVHFKSGTDAQETAIIRYNITALESLANTDNALILAALEDNGPDARVLLEIVEYGFETNDSQVILTLDSNDAVASDERQTLYEDCGGNFNFADNAYIVKATLEKTGTGGTPALHDLVVLSEVCP